MAALEAAAERKRACVAGVNLRQALCSAGKAETLSARPLGLTIILNFSFGPFSAATGYHRI